MSVTNQLFQLQEVDLRIEAGEQVIKQMTAELGESDLLRNVLNSLAEEQKRFDSLSREQHSLEWEIDDVSAKLSTLEKELYSGRIKIPKELSSLQQEVSALKVRRTQLEDKALAVMEQTESSQNIISRLTAELKVVETEWKSRQDVLNRKIENEKETLLGLVRRQQEMIREIEGAAIKIYQTLRKQKGSAVAKVEQGICRGCRISLPSSEIQGARSGALVQCGSCGRILYLP